MVDLGSIHSSFKMAPYASITLKPDDPKYTISDVNDAFLKLTYTDRSIIGLGFFEAFPPNSNDSGERTTKLNEAFEYAYKKKEAHNIPVHRYDLKTGADHDIRFWSLDTFPMLDVEGQVKYIVFCITDITETKRTTELQQLEHVVLELNSQKNADLKQVLMTYLHGLEAMFPYMRTSILQISNGKLYTLVSPVLPVAYQQGIDGQAIGAESGSCGTAAYTKKTVISEDIQTDFRWEKYKQLAGKFNLAACWSYPIIDTNGKVMAVLSVYSAMSRYPSIVETEILDRVVALLEVIMENKQYAESLKEATMLMIQGQELAQFGTWSWEIASDTVKWSDTLYDIYGVKKEQFPATFEGYLGLLHPGDKDRVYKLINDVLITKVDVEFEERIIRPDGEKRYLKSWGKLKVNEDGVPVKMIGACLDVTKMKEIAWAQTHLVREPLTRIMSISKLLAEPEIDRLSKEKLLCYLDASAGELDEVVKEIISKSEEWL